MDEATLVLWRAAKLKAAVDKLDDGNFSAFGRRIGYKSGDFVRQMTTGKRAISEKTVRKIEALPGMRAWFDPSVEAVPSLLEIRAELESRDVPPDVLNTIVAMLRGFPPKRRTA